MLYSKIKDMKFIGKRTGEIVIKSEFELDAWAGDKAVFACLRFDKDGKVPDGYFAGYMSVTKIDYEGETYEYKGRV